MDQPSLESALADLHLPAIRFFDRIDSTNDEAWRWISAGAPNGALVIAEEQTAGRGRLNRRWITLHGMALAFSLVLLSPPLDHQYLPRLTGLGALAACNALQNIYSLNTQIKWPNDILVDGLKLGGVLAEAHWSGQTLQAAVIGIGINIAPQSVSAVHLPPLELTYPTTSVESMLSEPVDRLELLHAILQELFDVWLPRLSSPDFIREWEANLAFRGQWVEISAASLMGGPGASGMSKPGKSELMEGKVMGLNHDGSLILSTRTGELVHVAVGEMHLRPMLAGQRISSAG